MSDSSSSSSTSSLPPAPSPPKTPLETLISHLLSSKRSLTTTTPLIYRANALVTTSRSILEATLVTTSRATFLRRGLSSQLKLLQSVQAEVESGVEKAQREFGEVLRGLDESEQRLRSTLEYLRETTVEEVLRPEVERLANSGGKDGKGKCLLDFVDERGVEVLEGGLKGCIDGINGAVGEVEEEIRAFEEGLRGIREGLRNGGGEGEAGYEDQDARDAHSPMPTLLATLESHAKEMADLLESLVRHFDLCVAAVKHTEGGGAAARSITGDLPPVVDVSKDSFDAPAEPITDEERAEMIAVLSKDATEVDDVVLEIQDRISEMEVALEHVLAYKDKVDTSYASITTAFMLLEQTGAALPTYILTSRTFHARWASEHQRIISGMSELDALRDFYDGFVKAYYGLIIEVARRRNKQDEVDRAAQEFRQKLDRLYEEDLAEREAFKQDQGDFLPSDIWPGLVDPPVRYAVVRMDGEGAGAEVPRLPRRVVEMAYRRLNAEGTI